MQVNPRRIQWNLSAAQLEARTLEVGTFLLPLAFFWSTLDQFVLPKLLFARLLVLLLGGLRLYRWSQGEGSFLRITPVNLPLFAFVTSAALATAFAVNLNVALFGTYLRYEGLFTIATYAALFCLTASALRDRQHAAHLLRVLAASGYVVAVIAVLQTLVSSPFLPSGAGESEMVFGHFVRATATFGNANALAAFLAMLIPFAVDEMLTPGPVGRRVMAANQAAVMSIALAFTFSRGAWLATATGLFVMLAFRRGRSSRAMLAAGVAAVFVVAVVLLIPPSPGFPIWQSIHARMASIGSPLTGSAASRAHIWRDTLALAASRPLTGYGPDTFGLVYPTFQTGNWTPGLPIDKAHSDLLQVAATQGVLGVGAYVWMLLAFLTAFARSGRMAPGVFGGFIAYQLQLQVNFSYLPAAAPFWLFAGAAVVLWSARTDPEPATTRPIRLNRLGSVVALTAAIAGLAVPAVILPYVADVKYRDALADKARGDYLAAGADLEAARRLVPNESVYAAEAGDVALRLQGETIGPNADWGKAREEFNDAVRLGTFTPSVFRHLAIVDAHLGLRDQALAAARRAVSLDRFDPANQQLLDKLEQSPSAGWPRAASKASTWARECIQVANCF
jgi:O-antigen ligase